MDSEFKLASIFLNPFVVIYLVTIVLGQLGYALWRWYRQTQVESQRRKQGLPKDILLSAAETLVENKWETSAKNIILLLTILVVPFVLVYVGRGQDPTEVSEEQTGLAIVFLGLLLWVLINMTDVAKAFLGGLALRTVLAFKKPTPFQLGDRVTLKGIGGKVVAFDSFFVTLQTLNDDQISIPTSTLWSEVLNSANAGERASLCVASFYLAPFVTKEQRDAAEDAVWEAIQASPYYTPSKPMQIYFAQKPDSIELTAKAYVASTYNEPLFTSDITRAFLDFAARTDTPLSSSAWRRPASVPPLPANESTP